MKNILLKIKKAALVCCMISCMAESYGQNWNQAAKVNAGDRSALTAGMQVEGTIYGRTVAIAGDYVAAGAMEGNKGVVYISRKVSTKWVQIKKIASPEPGSFGNDLAMDGAYLIVTTGTSAYIYKKDAGGADNWGLIKKLAGSAPAGYSAAIKGDYAVIGAPDDNTDMSGGNPLTGAGSAFIFRKNEGGTDNWGQIKKVNASVRSVNDRFGATVSISSGHIIVGSVNTATIFQRDKGGIGMWGLAQGIILPDLSDLYYTEHAVSISEDYAVVGLANDDLAELGNRAQPNAGSVLIYKNDHNTTEHWSRIQKINNPNPVYEEHFGTSVAIEGSDIIAGAPNNYEGAGVAYTFRSNAQPANPWQYVSQIVPVVNGFNNFGGKVAINGGRFVTGSMYESFVVDQIESTGAVYVYQKNAAGSWGLDKRLVIMRTTPQDQFGYKVAISGNYAVVGAIHDDVDENGENYVESAGSAYIFFKNAGRWQQIKKLAGTARKQTDRFGFSVAVHDTLVVVGVPFEGQQADKGAAYIYSKNQGGINNWGLISKLVPPTSQAGQFGYSVALDNGYIAIGAIADNYVPTSGSTVPATGAVYLYQKGSQNNWNLVKKINARVPAQADHFGWSVAMSGNYLMVGAPDEDNDATENNYLVNAGSTYLYGKDTGGNNNWGQVKKITGDVRTANGRFGLVLSMSSDHALVTSIAGKGSATVYNKDMGGTANWGIVKKLVTPEGTPQELFGYSASISDNYAVVGAYAVSGSAYVFGKNQGGAGNWGQQQKLLPAVPGPEDRFGFAVATSGSDIIVGAPYEDEDAAESNTLTDAGSVYLFQTNAAEPETGVTLGPIADASVRNGSFSAVNFGSAIALDVKTANVSGYSRNAYLKFSLAGISPVSSAKLRIFGLNSENTNNIQVAAYGIGNDSWTEKGIAWNNAPAVSGTILGSFTINNNAKYYEIDVTAFVLSQLAGDKVVSIALINPTNQNSQVTLNSRENTAGQPQLVIEYLNSTARMSQEILTIDPDKVSTVFPNPARKHFFVEISDQHVGQVSMQLTSLTGKKYLIGQPQSRKVTSKMEFDISSMGMSAGIYLLKIQSAATTELVKLLVIE